jgi:hypothetical protein
LDFGQSLSVLALPVRNAEEALLQERSREVPDERTTLKNAIDRYLKQLAPEVWYRKKWGGGAYQHKGDPDYYLCAWGRYVAIEAKHPIKQPELEADQTMTLEKLQKAGAFVIHATSVQDVVNGLDAVRRIVGKHWKAA